MSEIKRDGVDTFVGLMLGCFLFVFTVFSAVLLQAAIRNGVRFEDGRGCCCPCEESDK